MMLRIAVPAVIVAKIPFVSTVNALMDRAAIVPMKCIVTVKLSIIYRILPIVMDAEILVRWGSSVWQALANQIR